MLSKKPGVLLRVVVGIEPTPCAIGGGVYPRCKLTLLVVVGGGGAATTGAGTPVLT
jgi:hypothetical protein